MSILKKPDPLRELQAIQQQINRVFEERLKGEERGAELEPVLPPVDLWETDDEIVLEAELPGVVAADVTVEVKGKTLTLKGERKASPPTGVGGKTVHRIERESGSFNRTFTLSKSVDRFGVETSSKDGILQVRLSKEAGKPKKRKG